MRAARTRRRMLAAAGAIAGIAGLVTGCTAGADERQHRPHRTTPNNTETGDTVTIGFSGPAADHGWLGAINSAAIAEAEKYDDVELVVAEGTNDANLQISQVETFINDGVDAIVLLPTDGAALTEVAIKAMEAGIPVINVDREFSSTVRRTRHRSSVTTTAWASAPAPTSARSSATTPTPSSPRSPASTRSRSRRTARRASPTRSTTAGSR